MTSNGLLPDGVVGRDGGLDETERPPIRFILYLLVFNVFVFVMDKLLYLVSVVESVDTLYGVEVQV